MGRDLARIKNTSLWYREVNIDGAMTLLEVENTSMGDLTVGGIPGSTPVISSDALGQSITLFSTEDPATDQSTFDVSFRLWLDTRHPLTQQIEKAGELYFQRLYYSCPPLNSRNLWKQLQQFHIRVTGATEAATRDLTGSDGSQDNTVSEVVINALRIFKTSLSALTSGTALDVLSIAGLDDDNDCLPGYPGRDRVLFAGLASSAAPAEIYYSVTGGGAWAAIVTDPTPFTVNSDITFLTAEVIDEDNVRLVASRATDAGTKTQWAYQDISVVGSTITVASWNVITIAATSNADAFEAGLWLQEASRNYLATAGDIYVGTDNWETDPGAAKFTGSNAFAAMVEYNGDVWAVGASNTINVERANKRDTWVVRTGPSGGGAFTAISFANDGTMFAGNGTSIFKSNNEAANTTGWSSLKDFGASHVVKHIECEKGSSIILTVYVDDTTPGAGEAWRTEDGGNSWTQISETVNTGYNAVYPLFNPREAIIVGDGGTIEQLA